MDGEREPTIVEIHAPGEIELVVYGMFGGVTRYAIHVVGHDDGDGDLAIRLSQRDSMEPELGDSLGFLAAEVTDDPTPTDFDSFVEITQGPSGEDVSTTVNPGKYPPMAIGPVVHIGIAYQ